MEVFIRNTGKTHGRKYAFLGEDSAVLQLKNKFSHVLHTNYSYLIHR